ncbi:MAG: hypothetical protein AAFY56_17070 [Pseudomonadota bacterium]
MTTLVIGLDAGELNIIRRLIDQGRLPTIAHLFREGTEGHLEPRLGEFEGMNWDRWLEGRDVSRRYHHKVWRPDRMGYSLSWTDEYLPRQPFWQDVASAGAHVGVMDIHFCGTHRQPDVSWILQGWQLSSDPRPASRPLSVVDELKQTVGKPAMGPEIYGRQTGAGLLKLRTELIAAAEQAGRIVANTIAAQPFDLFVMCFGSVHLAGHYLWDASQIDAKTLTRDDLRLIEGALDEVYIATDKAIGRILDAAPAGTRTVLFATYGMGPNPGWAHHLPAMIDRIAHADKVGSPKQTPLGHIKDFVPIQSLMAAGRKLPSEWRDRMVRTLSPRLEDWSRRRFMALPGEPHGFVRVNLKGRELNGAVEPGSEYGDLLETLSDDLKSFVDRRTGIPIVETVVRTDDLISTDAPERMWLPDLVVVFTTEIQSQPSDGIVSPRLGEVRWQEGKPHVSGRAGNHLSTAWYCANGPGFQAQKINETYDTIDMAPSIVSLMGLSPDSRFDGRVIPALAKPALEMA